MKRAVRLQLQLPGQTTDKGYIKPFMDRRFTSDQAVLDFFEEAMAAVLLLHAALDSYANESMPEGLTVSWKGQTLSRDDLEQRGIKLRLTVALPALCNLTRVTAALRPAASLHWQTGSRSR